MSKVIKVKAGQKVSINIDTMTAGDFQALYEQLKAAIEDHEYTITTNYDYTITFVVK
jgi:hypothetical protein